MFCKYCGKQTDDAATFCPYCGAKIKEPIAYPPQHDAPSQKKPANGFGIAGFVVGIVSLVLGFYFMVGAIVGIVLSAVGVTNRAKYTLNGLAIAGLAISCTAFLFWGIFWFYAFFSISFLHLLFLPFLS